MVFVYFSVPYRSLEAFIDAVAAVNAGDALARDFEHSLASIGTTHRTTAILEAGRRSLDHQCTVEICYDNTTVPCLPTRLHVPGQK